MAEPQTPTSLTPAPLPAAPQAERVVRRALRRTVDKSAAAGIMSRPLFGKLPLRRLIPQDVHSLLDYQGGTTSLVAGLLADDPRAKAAGVALGGGVIGLSLVTDYRLSLTKLVPIEAHELGDYVYGAAAILAPFLFGYARRSPIAAAVHVVVGLSTLLASLVTDYRCQTGMHLGGERVTDPEAVGG